jgi:hypothetical protein
MKVSKLEQRVAALEAEVARLREEHAAEGNGSARPWWDKVFGTLPNDEMTLEAEQLGREWRKSFKPVSKKVRRKRAGARHRSRKPAAARR